MRVRRKEFFKPNYRIWIASLGKEWVTALEHLEIWIILTIPIFFLPTFCESDSIRRGIRPEELLATKPNGLWLLRMQHHTIEHRIPSYSCRNFAFRPATCFLPHLLHPRSSFFYFSVILIGLRVYSSLGVGLKRYFLDD